MSKVARKPIEIPEGVTITQDGSVFAVKGKLGELSSPILKGVKVEMKDGSVQLSIDSSEKQIRANWGTTGSHLKNAIQGVTEGFKKDLIIQGVGFRVADEGGKLALELGFSHTVHFPIPEGIKTEVDSKKNTISISGINKYLVGQTAAKIRALKKPEPYLGKGIRYADEVVRRKAGKKVTA